MEEFAYPESTKPDIFVLLQKNLRTFESTFGVELAIRGNKIMFDGPAGAKKLFRSYLDYLGQFSEQQGSLKESDIRISLSLAREGKLDELKRKQLTSEQVALNGRMVMPKTFNQNTYIQAVRRNDLTFSIGPAGTGKTYLAIAMALQHLFNRDVERLVLTRPVVEAGEKLGFLPGDIQQKVNPYFRPLYDALYHLAGFEKTSDLIEKGIIEIAPLAYMRGRTINNAFIILDEGQNTSNAQMKMFLTRFGSQSKVVVTADVSQIDLADPKKSGIFKALKILGDINGIAVVTLTGVDVVRHSLVQRIIEAYEKKP